MPIHPPSTHEPHGPGALSGRAAVVTGSSSGIGRAIALALASDGARVLVHARANRSGAEETARTIRRLGHEAVVVLRDLAEPAQQDALVDDAWAWGEIDIWINNAGADILTGDAAKLPFDEKLACLWLVDVIATVRLSRSVGRRMAERGRGVILNTGWNRAAIGMAGNSGELFAAAKGAVASFSRSLAKSLAPNVRVNCLAPGWVKTKWGDTATAIWQRRAEDESLARRWGTAEDVAQVARFLCSDAAAFVNGQVINIDGGVDDRLSDDSPATR